MRSFDDIFLNETILGLKPPQKPVSKRCHKAWMPIKYSQNAMNCGLTTLYLLQHVYFRTKCKKIWIELTKNLKNAAFSSLYWRAEIGENSHF